MEPNIKKVLLLDDDGELKTLVKDFLQTQFFLVTAVSNGIEGLQLVLKNNFDVILCDMKMPNLSGEMFYRAVERSKPHLCQRFIFITGSVGNPAMNEFFVQTGAKVVAKPFQFSGLLEAISEIIKKTAAVPAS